MALVLGAQIGDAFLVGRRRVYVSSIDGPTQITLTRDDHQNFSIGSEEPTEVFPDVFIGIGPEPATGRHLRLLFDAPQTILIIRDRGNSP